MIFNFIKWLIVLIRTIRTSILSAITVSVLYFAFDRIADKSLFLETDIPVAADNDLLCGKMTTYFRLLFLQNEGDRETSLTFHAFSFSLSYRNFVHQAVSMTIRRFFFA